MAHRSRLDADARSIALWSWLVGVLMVSATLPPLLRWIDAAVDDLLAVPQPTPAALMGVGARLWTSTGPAELAGALAGSVARLMTVPYVAIELDRTDDRLAGAWAQPLRASTGDAALAGVIHREPLVFQGSQIGMLLVSGRRKGRPLQPADTAVLADLAQTVALVVSSVRLAEQHRVALQQSVVAREDERRRLRRELHDGLGPTLSALKLQLAALRRSDADPAQRRVLLDELHESLLEASADVRRVVYGLRPPMLDDLGLVSALRSLPFIPPELRYGVCADLALERLPAAVEVALYRIAAEAVHNAVRHASATECTVRLSVDASVAAVRIVDDGCGIDGAAPGVGLRSMHERAHELGGIVTVETAPGGGTAVFAMFPLAEADAASHEIGAAR